MFNKQTDKFQLDVKLVLICLLGLIYLESNNELSGGPHTAKVGETTLQMASYADEAPSVPSTTSKTKSHTVAKAKSKKRRRAHCVDFSSNHVR